MFTVPDAACARHMVVIGATGSGKTNLMIRLWAGWFTATLARRPGPGQGTGRCWSCWTARADPTPGSRPNRTRRLLYGAGARRVAIWPDEARLSLWDLPPNDLAVLLFQMIDTGTGAAAYYADILQAALTLAVAAPGRAAAERRRVPGPAGRRWLQHAWGDGRHPGQLARVRRRAPGTCPTSSSGSPPCSAGSARPWTALAPWPTPTPGTSSWKAPASPPSPRPRPWPSPNWSPTPPPTRTAEPRAILLAADDYSAVSRRVPLSNLYERGRSLGIGVQVSAQSWQGLGRDDDERYRIAATADGGIWVLQHPATPSRWPRWPGTRRVLETAHKLVGVAWGDEGTTREQHAWTADPDLIRRLQVGQACYIHRGAATFVQVARPKASPLTLPPARAPVGAAKPPPRNRSRGRAGRGQPR